MSLWQFFVRPLIIGAGDDVAGPHAYRVSMPQIVMTRNELRDTHTARPRRAIPESRLLQAP